RPRAPIRPGPTAPPRAARPRGQAPRRSPTGRPDPTPGPARSLPTPGGARRSWRRAGRSRGSLRRPRALVAVKGVLVHQAVERGAVDTREAGGLRHVAAGTRDEARQVFLFELGHDPVLR